MMITAKRARELLKKFKQQRILVIGDVMLDRYLYGTVERISPEAPVPVVKILRQRQMPRQPAVDAALPGPGRRSWSWWPPRSMATRPPPR